MVGFLQLVNGKIHSKFRSLGLTCPLNRADPTNYLAAFQAVPKHDIKAENKTYDKVIYIY